jgi:small subunit ribosomal protein S3Ae
MARPKSKARTSRSVDKWKLKKQFDVIAPDVFNNVRVGAIVANDAEKLVGRRVDTTLSKLVSSNQHHIKLKLRVSGIDGFNANTKVDEVELSGAYISSQIYGGADIIEYVFRTKVKSEEEVRIKLVMFSRKKIHSDQRKALRRLAEEIINEAAVKDSFDQFIQEAVFGKIGSQIFNRGKKIVPLGRVEIRMIELIR